MDEDKIHATIRAAMVEAGTDPAIIYAFDQTHRVVAEENKGLLTAEDLAEWDAAVAEYRRLHPP